LGETRKIRQRALMLKLFIAFFLLFTTLNADFKVASWNLKNVSLNSLMFKKSIGEINEYIKSINDFDVIALQELRDRQIIFFLSGGLKEILFSDFKRLTSSYKGKGTHKEVYGFLVNDKYKNVQLVELGNYRDFKRPPSAVILENAIAVVNIHIVYGKRKLERVSEVKKLKKIVLELERDYKIKKENIVIAGDFNLRHKDVKTIFQDANVFIEEKTTIGKTKRSQNYDHFITFSTAKASIKVRADLLKNHQFYRKNISDHLPIEFIQN
jgi:endonuclease/exonuclease/phosphatase family metal-dependent hydrolase